MTTHRSLSPVRRHGTFRIATLDERQVGAWTVARMLTGSGTKRPLAVLIETADGVLIRDMDGQPLSRAALDALRPGTLTEFAAAAQAAPDMLKPIKRQEEETNR